MNADIVIPAAIFAVGAGLYALAYWRAGEAGSKARWRSWSCAVVGGVMAVGSFFPLVTNSARALGLSDMWAVLVCLAMPFVIGGVVTVIARRRAR